MDEICKKIREQIPELIGEGLSPEKAVELEQHRSQCPACNGYFEALEADDRLLCKFAESMQPNVARLENTTMDQLRRQQLSGAIKTTSIGKRILDNRVAQMAAAILIVAAILVGAVIFRGSPEKPMEIVDQSNEPATVTAEPPRRIEQDSDAVALAESRELRRMIAASDVSGVMAMLSYGQPRSKIAAANYLATVGDARAISVLARLTAEWQGEAARNPFAAAIAQIMNRLQEQEQSNEVGDDDEDAVVAETTTVDDGQDVGCKGVVVDELGRPIADARILLYHNRSRWGLGNRTIEETISASDGSFVCRNRVQFSKVKEHSYAQDSYILMATHPDYAFGWRNIRQGSEQDEFRIVMTSPTSRTITVTDNKGSPLAGVRVWPYSAGDRESSKAVFRDYLSLATDVGLSGAITDANGLAVVMNLPDTGCSFHATGEGYAEGLAFPGQATISLTKGANVSGWVLKEEKEPVAGAIVRFATNWMNNYFLVVTDEEGYFHFKDLPAKGWDQSPWGNADGASGSYTITVEHESCAAAEVNLTLEPGQSIDDFIVEAYSETTLVECHVVEFGTDMPVAGARIQGQNRIGRINGYSDSEGVFTVRVLPGRVSLRFLSPPDGVYILEDQEPSESRLNFNATGEKMT
ncbi:MAG: hypothetical protein JSW59_11445, partial [Phycisphaerales bacterium]